jgi:SPFH domain / Band 7 family
VYVLLPCFFLCCLIGFSFSKLDGNEVGLDYSANSLTLDTSQVYSAGVHFLGVGHRFIKFPGRVVTLPLGNDIVARSSDGLGIQISGTVTYTLDISANNLGALYTMFGEAYEAAYFRICRTVVHEVCVNREEREYGERRDR